MEKSFAINGEGAGPVRGAAVRYRTVIIIAIGLLMAACGGDDPPTPPPPPPPDVVIDTPFGEVPVGNTMDRMVTLSGGDTTGVSVQALPVLPAPFSIVEDKCSFAYIITSCTFTIRFSPTATGAYSHRFDVPSDADNKATVTMSGTGIDVRGGGQAPAAPNEVSATPGDGQVTIRWNAVADATSYRLYYRPATSTVLFEIANVTSPYLHTGLSNGTEYLYVIKAENESGTSAESIPAAATPVAASPPVVPTVGWTGLKQFGTASDDEAYGMAVDSAGNVYVVGETWGGLNYAGGGDVFLVKFGADGELLWDFQFGTIALDSASGVAVDASGNVYVVGQTWGGLHGNIFSGGDGDGFVTKIDAAGVRQWTAQIGTTGRDSVYSAAVDSNGNVHVAGETGGSLGGSTFAGGDSDAFVAKYDVNGVPQWHRQFGAGGSDGAAGVAVDAGGNVHVAGWVSGDLHGRPYVGGVYDAFVVKYDASGTRLWTEVFGAQVGVFAGSETDIGRSVAVDSNGNVYVGGNTTGALDGDISKSVGGAFVVKYDATGMNQWTRQFVTGGTVIAHSVAVDLQGGVVVAGQVAGGLGGNRSAGFDDAFVMKFDGAGVRLWTRQPGSSSLDYAYGVAVSATGDIFAVGSTTGDMTGNARVGESDFDAFVVRYDAGGGG